MTSCSSAIFVRVLHPPQHGFLQSVFNQYADLLKVCQWIQLTPSHFLRAMVVQIKTCSNASAGRAADGATSVLGCRRTLIRWGNSCCACERAASNQSVLGVFLLHFPRLSCTITPTIESNTLTLDMRRERLHPYSALSLKTLQLTSTMSKPCLT